MPNTTPIQGTDTLDQGRQRINEHFAAVDPHDQYLTSTEADAAYVNETDHTKATHDALGIDAATLDGIDSTGFARVGVADGRDANLVTALVDTDATTQRFTVALTANRTITLPTTNNYNGKKFRVVRTDTAAFSLAVGTLRTIPASTAAWVDVEHNGTAWVLTGYGTL